MKKLSHAHIYLSVTLYLSCLALPGYYGGAEYAPSPSLTLLLMGWLGVLYGYWAWLANPIFLWAVLSTGRPLRSGVLSVLGLMLALSFLTLEEIVASEAPTFKQIVAYDWGYALWIAAFATLAAGELCRAAQLKAQHTVLTALLATSAVLLPFVVYDSRDADSPSQLRAARNTEFAQRCASAGLHVAKKVENVRSVFLDPDWDMEVATDQDGQTRRISHAGLLGLGHLNSRHLSFYETRNPAVTGEYLRRTPGALKPTKSDSLESEYAVVTESFAIPRRLNITGKFIQIKDLSDNSVLASATYFIDNQNGRFCGPPGTRFSTSMLMSEVLGLKPSVLYRGPTPGAPQ